MPIEKDGEAVIDADVEAAAQAALSSQEPGEKGGSDERDYETDAREMGWRPKDDWKGDPANWKDAKTYVEHGDHINRIVEARVAKVRKESDERFSRLEKTTKTAIDNIKAQAAKEIEGLKAEKKAAVKAGNVEEVERIDAAIEELKEAGPERPLAGAALEKHNEKVQGDWIAANPWYDTDEEMSAYAIGVSQRIAAKTPNISIEDNLAQVDAAMRKKYPDKFGGKKEPGANGHAPVDGGSVFSGGRPKGKATAADLPPEARRIGAELVRAGAFKDIEAYAKAYAEESPKNA